jgi:hypothetical protein
MPVSRYLPVLLAVSLPLGGCGGSSDAPQDKSTVDADPLMEKALAEEIMVDPDLTAQNPANAGFAMSTADASLPPDNNSSKEIEAARSKAYELVGGKDRMTAAPEPRIVTAGNSADDVIGVAARAATLGPEGANCAGKVQYTTAWAARMPTAFPVYPHGNVKEAAGTDQDGCGLRAVTYTTPVAQGDVLDFYYTRAAAAGFRTDRIRQGHDEMLGGAKGKVSYLVSARQLPTGRTEVDLITSGR